MAAVPLKSDMTTKGASSFFFIIYLLAGGRDDA